MDFKKLNFIYFGFGEINTFINKEGKEKKLLNKRTLPDKNAREKLTPETSYTGISTAILCGKKSNITVIDCDTSKAYDSLLLQYPDFKNYYTVSTNKGYHVYCSYCDKVSSGIKPIKDVDIINDGYFIIAPPTKYTLLNGSLAQYKFIGGSKLGSFPDFLIKLVGDIPTKTTNIIIKNDSAIDCEFLFPIKDNYNCIPFLKILDKKRVDGEGTIGYQYWINLGCLIYSLDLPCVAWDYFSKQSSKYEEGECEYKWQTFTSKRYTIGTLFHWCKNDNPVEYTRLKKEYNFNIVFDEPIEGANIEYHNIEERYLLENDLKTIKQSIDTHLERLFTDNSVSSLNIKSPYGTSKTQLLIKTIKKYKPKKILFLSYRKSLTYDLQNNFEILGFGNYMEDTLNCNRLIVQSESLLKLDSIYFDQVPKYDLVIIDESESVLNNFSSTTFKGKSDITFDYLRAIIENCGKLITLDGDQNNRTYSFTSSFSGTSINIINTINFNEKTIVLTDSEFHYKQDIYKSIDSNKRIVICSQSATIAEEYYNVLKEKYPQLKVALYIGKTDDTIKTEHSKNINIFWEVDILIYSPCIEAGCNFDKDWFDNEYCILSTCSSSQRATFQMLARVRKFKSNKILTYTNGIKDYDIAEFYTFHQVKDALVESRDKVLKYGYEKDVEGVMRRVVKLDSYDINNIYNKVEDLNKNEKYYLAYFKSLATSKGFKIEYLVVNPFEDTTDELEDNKKESKYDELINTKDINEEEFYKLLEKQNKSKATREDKLQIEKQVWKQRLGVSKLNEDILKMFHKKEYLITNYISLIDPTNKKLMIKNCYDDKREDVEYRLIVINQIIKTLGFKNINDNNVLSESQFDEKFIDVITQTPLFNESAQTVKVRFNLSKTKIDTSNKDNAVKYINELLKNYSIKLERTYLKGKKKEKHNRVYQIIKLNSVDEIIYNLVQSKSLTLSDQHIFIEPSNKIFSDLVDTTWFKNVKTVQKVSSVVDLNTLDEPEIIETKTETSNPQPAIHTEWVCKESHNPKPQEQPKPKPKPKTIKSNLNLPNFKKGETEKEYRDRVYKDVLKI